MKHPIQCEPTPSCEPALAQIATRIEQAAERIRISNYRTSEFLRRALSAENNASDEREDPDKSSHMERIHRAMTTLETYAGIAESNAQKIEQIG